MKSIKVLLLVCAILIGSQSIASITKSKNLLSLAPLPEAVQTTREIMDGLDAKPEEVIEVPAAKSTLTPEMIESLRACQPYDEKYDLDFMGFSFSFALKIDGWVDNKCNYHLSARVNRLGEDIRKSYNIKVSDADIAKFEPKVQCGFNKEQLELLVDAVVEEDKRSAERINQLMSDPEKYTPKSAQELTPQEKKLVDMLMKDNVCYIVNQEELMQLFTEMSETYAPKTEVKPVSSTVKPAVPADVSKPVVNMPQLVPGSDK